MLGCGDRVEREIRQNRQKEVLRLRDLNGYGVLQKAFSLLLCGDLEISKYIFVFSFTGVELRYEPLNRFEHIPLWSAKILHDRESHPTITLRTLKNGAPLLEGVVKKW